MDEHLFDHADQGRRGDDGPNGSSGSPPLAGAPAGLDVVEAVRRLLGALAAEDLDAAPASSVAGDAVVLLELAEALRTEAVRRLARQAAEQAWCGDGATSASAWLLHRVDVPRSEAVSLTSTARLCAGHPEVARTLVDGRITLTAARQLAGVATAERAEHTAHHLDVLLDVAATLTPRQRHVALARWRSAVDDDLDAHAPLRRRRATIAALPDGTVHLSAHLDAANGTPLLAAVDHLSDPDPADVADGPRTATQRRADALGQIARRYLSTTNQGDPDEAAAPVATVEVAIDLADLLVDLTTGSHLPTERTGGSHLATPDPVLGRCEVAHLGPVPRRVAQRLACDSWLGRTVLAPDAATIDALLDGNGPLGHLRDTPLGHTLLAAPSEPIDVGRRRRTFTTAQRRAISARDRHCSFPGCDRPPSWCDVHHLDPWDHGGRTDTSNSTLLCAHHHTVVHVHAWYPERRDDGTWTFHPPERASPRAA